MAFEIKKVSLSDFEEIAIHNTLSNTCIKIITKGALLNSWTIQKNNQCYELIDGNHIENTWNEFEINGFKSAKMSPFSCRLKNGTYQLNNVFYTIEKFYLEKHALHGIIYDMPFKLVLQEKNENAASIKLLYQYNGFDKGYPFPFDILVTYTLTLEDQIIISTTINNCGSSTIPIMDGWHPYFQLDCLANDISIQFENDGKVEYDNELIPTGNFIKDDSFQLSNSLEKRHLDDCFIMKKNSSLTLIGKKISIEVTPLLNYPYIQLYTPNHRKSIAVENLSALPNCFNNKIGLQNVKPNEHIEFKTQFSSHFL